MYWMDDEETEAFLDIWNDMNVEQQLEGLKSNNTAIYREISKEVCDRNFAKTADECSENRQLKTIRNFRMKTCGPTKISEDDTNL